MNGWHAIMKLIGATACWMAALFLIVFGVALSSTDHLFGGVAVAGGFFLVPPLLFRIRSRVSWTRPAWVPVAVAFATLPVGAIIHDLFKPISSASAGQPAQANTTRARPSGPHPALSSAIHDVPGTPQDPASVYAERIATYWLPQARALPSAPSGDDPAFGTLLTEMDGLVADIDDGSSLPLSPAQHALRAKLMTVLGEKQARLLPAMRQRYARELDSQFFRNDIRISAKGSTLTLVGAAFVSNANVEDMQTTLTPAVTPLRFRRVVYRWNRYFNDGLHYDLTAPEDRKIAEWNGTSFAAIGG